MSAEEPSNQKDIVKHLELIQAVIARMANHSFLLKGWTVTLAAALIALAAKESSRTYAIVALGPALVFWGLDAYYLRRERLFRALYDDVRADLEVARSGVSPFSMSTVRYENLVAAWPQTLRAATVLWLHGSVVVAVIIAIALLFLFPQKGN